MINTDNPIRIAIAGLGFGESVHIPASLSNKNIELCRRSNNFKPISIGSIYYIYPIK